MPRKIFFTYELVQASPSECKDGYVIYRTPFGPVKENNDGKLALQRQNEWIPLENAYGQLLLVQGRDSSGLLPKVVYDNNWDYIKDRLRTYWWVFFPLMAVAMVISILHAHRLWMSGAFVLAISTVLYCEHRETGIRRAIACLLWALAVFVAISFFTEIMYGALHVLKALMGLCDWMECGPALVLMDI